MTTDADHAAVLRLIVTDHWVTSEQGVAAIERAIVLLEREAALPLGPPGTALSNTFIPRTM